MNLKTIEEIKRLLKEREHIRKEINANAGGGRHSKAFWPHRNSNVFSLNTNDLRALDKLYKESLERREIALTTRLAAIGYTEN